MKRREIEKYMKEAMKIDAPESVWERIKSEPILVYTDSNEQRRSCGKTHRRAAAFAAAAFVIIAAVAAINKGNVFQQPPIIGENSTDSGNSLFIADDDTTLSAAPIPGGTQGASTEDATSPSEIDLGSSMGVCIPYYMVLNHRLYSANCESGLIQTDLGDEYTEMQNEYEVTVYSIKGVPLDQSFAIKANGMIIRYNFIYNGEFEIDSEKYGIVDTQAYYYPEPQKGKYLGTVEGMKVYEFLGNDKAVLIDLNPIVAIDGGNDEFLYAAEKLS